MDIRKINSDSELSIMTNLIQEYETEFSIITKKLPDGKGLFKLDIDLSTTDNFLIFKNDQLSGFCVKGSFSDRHDIHEFYIIPSQRNNKLGREFAKRIFSLYEGEWQVRQIEGATKATSFWRKAISEFTSNNFHEEITNDKYWGKVTKQTFSSKKL